MDFNEWWKTVPYAAMDEDDMPSDTRTSAELAWIYQQAVIAKLEKDIAHFKRRTERQARENDKLRPGHTKIVDLLDRNMDLIYEQDEFRKRLNEKQTRINELAAHLEEFIDITNESEGVCGYHLNGDIALWSYFDLKALSETPNDN